MRARTLALFAAACAVLPMAVLGHIASEAPQDGTVPSIQDVLLGVFIRFASAAIYLVSVVGPLAVLALLIPYLYFFCTIARRERVRRLRGSAMRGLEGPRPAPENCVSQVATVVVPVPDDLDMAAWLKQKSA